MKSRIPGRVGFYVLVGAILALALGLRLYGHNWDNGWYLHPDERFIAIVLNDRVHAPSLAHLGALLDPAHSPLNPWSNDARGRPQSFAYGTLPLYVTDFVAWAVGQVLGRDLNSYARVGSVGRALTALLDAGTVLLAVAFARRAFGRLAAVLTGLLLAGSVILIQLAHFFTTDAWVTFFAMGVLLACLELWLEARARWAILAGALFGAALATKISVVPLALPMLVAAAAPTPGEPWRRPTARTLTTLAVAGAAALAAFAVFEPYALLSPGPFLNDTATQWEIITGRFDVPFTRQFVGTTPAVYQIENLVLWGLGPALGVAAIAGVVAAGRRLLRTRPAGDILLAAWIAPYFLSVATAEAKFMRYLAPIVPALVILAGAWLAGLIQRDDRRAWIRTAGIGLTVLVVAGTCLWAVAFESIYSRSNTRIAASEWMYEHIPPGSTLTYEYWDDALPLAMSNGRSPQRYHITAFDLYADRENRAALGYIEDTLAKTDYVVLSSDRLAHSIPRLPWRYPVVSAYYDLLQSGQLGFQLVYEGTSYPRLGSLEIQDDSADESFTVYDHPRVRIYRKVRDLTPQEVDARFAAALDQPWSPTREAPADLLLSRPVDQMPAAHDLGWSDGLTRHAWAAIVVWLVVLAVVGLVTLPLSLTLFNGFSDLGWGFVRLVGLLAVGYVVWILVSLGLIHFELPWIAAILFAIGLASWVALRGRLGSLQHGLASRRRVILASEGVFLGAFAFFLLLRAINPDLWQTYWGGEKPMEMAFTSAIARSASFPPYDPWYAGGAMNYYYYGFYLIAMLWKLTGIPTEMAFQLAIVTVAALIASGVFSLTATLASDLLRPQRLLGVIGGGLAGLLLYLFIGNLDAAGQVVARGTTQVDFWQSSRAVDFAITEFPYFTMTWADLHPHAIALPLTIFLIALAYAWIRAARAAATPSGWPWLWLGAAVVAAGSIAVTNFWDMPFAVLLVGGTLLTRALAERPLRTRSFVAAAIRWGLIAGGAWILFRPFFSRFVALVGGVRQTEHGTAVGQYLVHFGIFLGILACAGIVLAARHRTAGEPSLVAGLSGALLGLGGLTAATLLGIRPDSVARLLGIVVLSLVVGAVIGAVIPWLASGAGVWALGHLAGYGVALVVGAFASARPTAALLLAILAVGVGLWLRLRDRSAGAMAALCLIGAAGVTLGADLIFIVDDLAGSPWERMNTVFKFYLEGWTLYALAATVALLWVIRAARAEHVPPAIGLIAGPPATGPATRSPATGAERPAVAMAALLISGVLVLGGLVYPLLATPVRLAQAMPGSPTRLSLDGLAWMRGSWIDNGAGQPIGFGGDYAAIQWLRDHASGLPVILEASIGPYRGNGSRVSAATGLPDVLGWDRHERQQRYAPGIDERLLDVRTIYNSPDPALKLSLLRKYRMRYVIVGDVERYSLLQPPFAGATRPNEPYASPEGLAAFDRMVGQSLKLVFQAGGTTIYEVLPFPSVAPAAGARGEP